jgi:DNA-binding NarL/FixJ family response regulator
VPIPGDLEARVLRGGPREIVLLTYTPAGAGLLTETERRVAIALAQGLSNGEIAAAHAVSVRTVANQVATIFEKLGVSSRSEVAAKFGILNLL